MAWVGLAAIAAAVRFPAVLRIGPNEGGGDEWYAAWRSWSVLFEHGNPGNFLHPALFYEAGAALFSALYLLGRETGAFAAPVDLLADFVRDEAKYLQALQGLAAACGALTVPAVFELARRLGGWVAGLAAAAALTLLPLHVLYSQRARVDSLCVLLTMLAALALHRLAERGRRRDFVAAGALVGLATAANYPAAFLGVAYAAAARVVRTRSRSAELGRSFGLGIATAVAVFALTNPYVLLTPVAAWNGFLFQLSLTVEQHPYIEKSSRWFYLHLLREQGTLFAIAAVGASAALAFRGHGFRRIVGLFPWLFIGAFVTARTQEDRYVLIAMPWLSVAIGVVAGDAAARLRGRGAPAWRTAIAGAMLVAVALVPADLWQRARPLVDAGPVEEHGRWAMQRWLLRHTPSGSTIWIESDVLPLLQATFADPGGRLQARMREAFQRAYPDFDAHVLKGELVERVANFDARLVTEARIDFAVSCDRSVRYVESAGPERAAQRAFYAALAERGTRRFEATGCWVAEVR